jgi:hypothetical protein
MKTKVYRSCAQQDARVAQIDAKVSRDADKRLTEMGFTKADEPTLDNYPSHKMCGGLDKILADLAPKGPSLHKCTFGFPGLN